jgi:hypothetical protein
VSSAAYEQFARAMRERKQVLCTYQRAPREVCPIVLGHSKGAERALAWQFGGTNEEGKPVRGGWKCLSLDQVSDIRLLEGPWHAGESHKSQQRCVEEVDLDVNPESPYSPRRKL